MNNFKYFHSENKHGLTIASTNVSKQQKEGYERKPFTGACDYMRVTRRFIQHKDNSCDVKRTDTCLCNMSILLLA